MFSINLIKQFLFLLLFSCSLSGAGWIWCKSYPWVYHSGNMEWLYIASDGQPWLHDGQNWEQRPSSFFDETGWVWMHDEKYGFSNTHGKWLYFGGQDETTNVYSTRYKDWKEWELATATNDITIDLNHVPVDLSGNPIFSNLLNNDPNLSLTLNNANSLTNLTELSGLSKLRNLKIWWANRLSDLTGLSDLPNLTTLSIDDANNLTDLTGLSDLTNLTSLTIYGDSLTDLKGLSGLTNLTSLTIYAKVLTDISALAELQNLTTLSLKGFDSITDNQITLLKQALPNTEISH